MTIHRPYPNVVRMTKGSRWAAYRPTGNSQKYLGSYDTPEAARRAVLEAQAANLEARARKYRAEAEELT